MPAPETATAQVGGEPPTFHPPATYATTVTKLTRGVPPLKPVALTHRPITYVNDIPALIFTSLEEEQLCRARDNTLIMKFSAGKPRLDEIRSHIATTWDLETTPAVGYLDPRHVTLNMATMADTNKALSPPTNKINNSLFRLFRWTPEFEIGKESSFVAVWVKLYNLPLHYYNEAALRSLGSLIGPVLGVDTHTLDLRHQVYARVCIELDVTKNSPDKLWIGTSKANGWQIDVEYEGNHAFCSYCGLLGHTVGLCRKKRQNQGKAPLDESAPNKEDDSVQKHITKERNKWIVKSKPVETQQESQLGQNNAIKILKKPNDGVNEDTRQALKNVGLLADEVNEAHHSEKINSATDKLIARDSEERHREWTHVNKSNPPHNHGVVTQEHNTVVLVDNDDDQEDIVRSSTARREMVNDGKNDSVVITTPTKNRFDVLDTEGELHKAYRNLNRATPSQQLALVTIPEDHQKNFSDGSGTKSKSNMGLPNQILKKMKREPHSG